MQILAQQNPLFAGALRILRRNSLLIGLVLAHFLAAVLVGAATGAPFDPGIARTLVMLFTILLPWFGVILVVWHFVRMAIYVRPEKPIGHVLADMKAQIFDVERIASGLLALTLISLFVGTFSFFKPIVPQLSQFNEIMPVWALDVQEGL